MRISVKSNIKDVKRQLTKAQRRQIPFAVKNALNDTAFGVRKYLIIVWGQSVNVKNRRYMAVALRITKATKQKQVVTIFDRLGSSAMKHMTQGGRQIPSSSRFLTVPTWWSLTHGGKRRRRKINEIFVGDPFKKGRMGVWEVKQTKSRGLRLLYNLEPSVEVDKRFPFDAAATLAATRAFPRNFDTRLRQALRTAR